MNHKPFITFVATILLVALVAMPAWTTSPGIATVYAQETTPQTPSARSVSVSGSGQVNVQPDVAIVQLGVQTSDAEATAALNANSEQMKALVNALQEAGVAQEDIQTQTIQLQPQYAGMTDNQPPQPQPSDAQSAERQPMNQSPEITGYIATNTVEVRTSDLANLGSLLDAVVAAGGNQIAGIRFEVSNATDAMASARETAWNDARQKAEQLATLAGAGWVMY
ncbi:MAG: SIMPL domain-containing protein [Caldilineaceae bacterium]